MRLRRYRQRGLGGRVPAARQLGERERLVPGVADQLLAVRRGWSADPGTDTVGNLNYILATLGFLKARTYPICGR